MVASEMWEVLGPIDGGVEFWWAGAQSSENFDDEVEFDDDVEYYGREEFDNVKSIFAQNPGLIIVREEQDDNSEYEQKQRKNPPRQFLSICHERERPCKN
jgi:hypothetical protein